MNLLSLAAGLFVASLAWTSCDDDSNATSKLPVFDQVTVSPQTASAGDTLTVKVTFSDSGSYVKGTYGYSTNPAAISGTFDCGSSQSSYSFTCLAPAIADTYILTVTPKGMAAYAGKKPFIDPSPMGSISTTFTVTKD